jgi:hypothetical protein
LLKNKGKGMNLMGHHVKSVAENMQWNDEDDDENSSSEDDFMVKP